MGSFDRLLDLHRVLHAIVSIPPEDRTFWQRLTMRFKIGRYTSQVDRYGAFIPLEVSLDTVRFGHAFNGVFICEAAKIGKNVTIFQHVTIGRSLPATGESFAPQIGDDVFIGANATLIGRCVIGDGAKIGAGVTLVDAEIPPGSVIINKSAYNLTEGRPVYQ